MTNLLTFLAALGFGTSGYLELRYLPQVRGRWPAKVVFLALDDPAHVERVVQRYLAANANEPSILMFGVNVRAAHDSGDAGVAVANAVVLDVDCEKAKGIAPGEQVRRIDAVCALAPPVAVVASGSKGHLHVYWRLPPTDPDEVRAIGKRLRVFAGCEPSEFPCKTMRAPFSWNWKHSPPAILISRIWPGVCVSIEQIDAALDAAGAPGLPLAALPRAPRLVSSASVSRTASLTPLAPALLDDLCGYLPGRLAALLRSGGWREGCGYPSKSEFDLGLGRALIDYPEANDAEIVGVLASLPPTGTDIYKGADYIQRTLHLLRSTESPGGPIVHARVVDVTRTVPLPWRPVLRLDVLDGPDVGHVFSQGVSLKGASVWGHVWASAGLPAPDLADLRATMVPLVGRVLRVQVGRHQWQGESRLEVKNWLPTRHRSNP